jgi:hypothetical protein
LLHEINGELSYSPRLIAVSRECHVGRGGESAGRQGLMVALNVLEALFQQGLA